MGALITREFPYTFHRIQVRAVRWQEVQSHNMSVLVQPGLQLTGMVPPRVVHDDQHFTVPASVTYESFKEAFKRQRVKCFGAVRQSIRPESVQRPTGLHFCE